jgi:hypothetical protein
MTSTKQTYDDLVLQAYCGELLGDGLFGALAERLDGEQRTKIELLQRIEQCTATTLRAIVEPGRLATVDEAAERAKGQAFVPPVEHFQWEGFLRALHDALPQFLDGFVRARELADDPNHPALAALVAHEQTISAFADLELAGHGASAHALLERYLANAE